jgi:hypothetical protein
VLTMEPQTDNDDGSIAMSGNLLPIPEWMKAKARDVHAQHVKWQKPSSVYHPSSNNHDHDRHHHHPLRHLSMSKHSSNSSFAAVVRPPPKLIPLPESVVAPMSLLRRSYEPDHTAFPPQANDDNSFSSVASSPLSIRKSVSCPTNQSITIMMTQPTSPIRKHSSSSSSRLCPSNSLDTHTKEDDPNENAHENRHLNNMNNDMLAPTPSTSAGRTFVIRPSPPDSDDSRLEHNHVETFNFRESSHEPQLSHARTPRNNHNENDNDHDDADDNVRSSLNKWRARAIANPFAKRNTPRPPQRQAQAQAQAHMLTHVNPAENILPTMTTTTRSGVARAPTRDELRTTATKGVSGGQPQQIRKSSFQMQPPRPPLPLDTRNNMQNNQRHPEETNAPRRDDNFDDNGEEANDHTSLFESESKSGSQEWIVDTRAEMKCNIRPCVQRRRRSSQEERREIHGVSLNEESSKCDRREANHDHEENGRVPCGAPTGVSAKNRENDDNNINNSNDSEKSRTVETLATPSLSSPPKAMLKQPKRPEKGKVVNSNCVSALAEIQRKRDERRAWQASEKQRKYV